MSGEQPNARDGVVRLVNEAGNQSRRACVAREMRYLLTISTDASKPGAIRPAGIAHSLGVCLIEDWNMARGKGQGKDTRLATMPKFVDVRLTADQKKEFLAWDRRGGPDLVRYLQFMADDGYRTGVSWSGEHQSYVASFTCRDENSPNNGLCMTSFAKTLDTALWLNLYKHLIIAEKDWTAVVSGEEGDFG